MIGAFLLPMLVQEGHEVLALSRACREDQQGVRWIKGDLSSPELIELPERVDVWINLTFITLFSKSLSSLLKRVAFTQVIAFSSTSLFTKNKSINAHECKIVSDLARGEHELRLLCEKEGVAWTVFRPTMIYCLGKDKNLSVIADEINRFRVFPLLGKGRGLRQPVHAEDLAKACVLAMYAPGNIGNKAYNLSGGEVLNYKSMVDRLFVSQGLSPRFIHIPVVLLRLLIHCLRMLPRYRYLTPDMADRMQKDMVFSHQEASDDFNYAPRSFQP
ncbi:NAD-dependent epimerase/dehydratase family protein [Mariprofundus ferrooxydans]|nr:NAD-dependent epimerase/dehydratase family protein [Mariprofundus ferrooxydans]